ncbi:MAG: hypothetical protein P9L91_09520 [Candidatus Zophobacter franzmannii]|jgi:hypothetical protein|nr:hypothetical protein [Candidatus Zophobacter franzmannii]
MKLFKVINDTVLLLSVLVNIFAMALAKIFGLYDLMEWHEIAGYVMIVALIFHLIFNFKVYMFRIKQLKKKK